MTKFFVTSHNLLKCIFFFWMLFIQYGVGAGKASNLKNWELAARHIARTAKGSKIVVEKSTLPVRTAHSMSRVLHANDRKIKFSVLSNPEFLAEGTAIRDLAKPDRVLIGAIIIQNLIKKLLQNQYGYIIIGFLKKEY